MHSLLEGGEDVRITWVLDAHHAHSVESTRSSSELNVVSFEVEHSGSTEDGHIFELGLSDGWAVVGDEDELGLTVSHGSHGELVTYQ